MRTTLALDEDVLDRARALAARMRTPFRRVVNEALRAGLKSVAAPTPPRKYRTPARALGLKPGRNLDNISELLAQVEGEEFR